MKIKKLLKKYTTNDIDDNCYYNAEDMIDFAKYVLKEKLTLSGVVASKRDETLELLEEIMNKVKKADSEVENGIYDPMLECAKNILNNYVIKRR